MKFNREDQRAQAIEAVGEPALEALGEAGFWVLKSHVTDEMHRAAKELREHDKTNGKPTAWGTIFAAMAAAGDLTRKAG